MARSISLHHLSSSEHPLLEEGVFSIFNDRHVGRTSSVTFSSELDGVCLISRSLDAFKVCSFGEARIFTKPAVTDQRMYLYKTNFLNDNIYDQNHRKHAKFIPGFDLLEISGAHLKVVGILDKDADVHDLQDKQVALAKFYFKNIFKQAIKSLRPQCRTRMNNLVITDTLPRCFRIYPEDVPQLSKELKRVSRRVECSYHFYFVYYKFGQQHIIPPNHLTLSNTQLDLAVNKAGKILCSSLHFAINFSHTSPDFSVFWSRHDTAQFLLGSDTKKYPFMGLVEIGNITSYLPHHLFSLLAAWPGNVQRGINFTYAQAYTPFVKPLDILKPFKSHPFLLTLLLGRDYIRHNSNFRHLVQQTETLLDYCAMREAVLLQLSRAAARFEVAVTSSRLRDVLLCDLSVFSRNVVGKSLLVQIPRGDISSYALALIRELVEPLKAALNEFTNGPGQLSTVLLCETILSFLPTMSVKDMPYHLLREYNITPIEGGVMASKRHLSLIGQATLRNGLLYLPRQRVGRVFVHLQELPGQARRQAYAILDFLDQMKTNNRSIIADKAAEIIIREFIDELVKSGIIARKGMLCNPRTLAVNGGSITSTITSEEYCKCVFDPRHLHSSNRLRAFIRLSLDLTSDGELFDATSRILRDECLFVPKAILHDHGVSFSSAQFNVLTGISFSSLISLRRPLRERECLPLLKATQSLLLRVLSLQPSTIKAITRYSLRTNAVISFLLRRRFSSQKSFLGGVGWVLIELAKLRGQVTHTYSARPLIRAFHLDRHITGGVVKAYARLVNAGNATNIVRNFAIDIQRCT